MNPKLTLLGILKEIIFLQVPDEQFIPGCLIEARSTLSPHVHHPLVPIFPAIVKSPVGATLQRCTLHDHDFTGLESFGSVLHTELSVHVDYAKGITASNGE